MCNVNYTSKCNHNILQQTLKTLPTSTKKNFNFKNIQLTHSPSIINFQVMYMYHVSDKYTCVHEYIKCILGSVFKQHHSYFYKLMQASSILPLSLAAAVTTIDTIDTVSTKT